MNLALFLTLSESGRLHAGGVEYVVLSSSLCCQQLIIATKTWLLEKDLTSNELRLLYVGHPSNSPVAFSQ